MRMLMGTGQGCQEPLQQPSTGQEHSRHSPGSGGRHGPCKLPGDQAEPRPMAERDQDTSLPAQPTRRCQSVGHPLRHPLPPKPRSAGEIRDMPQGQRKSL